MYRSMIPLLLTMLLISGCGATKHVSPEPPRQKNVSLEPMLDNPTRNEISDAGFASEPVDICLGLSSKFRF